MTAEDADHSPYELIWWQEPRDQLKSWALQAQQQKIVRGLADALTDLTDRLKRSPERFGDILREYKTIRAAEYRGIIPRWFVVWYGADHAAKVVIVRTMKPAPGSQLF